MNVFRTLLRQRLRRDRWQLIAWIASIGALTLFSAAAINNAYPTPAHRIGILRLAATDPSILAVRGAAQGSSAGAMLAFEVLGFITLMACLMSTFLAVRHSRAEEENGRAELIASTKAGRIAPTVATLVAGVIANLLVGLIVFLALIATGLPAVGSVLFAAGACGAGVVFVTVGLITAQVFSTSRAANGWAAALVGLAYLLRAAGDAGGTVHPNGYLVTSAWPSWLSPIGWAQLMSPYAANVALPVVLDLVLAAVLAASTLALQAVRDSDAGLIGQRSGRRTASWALAGPIGLAWRLQRGSIIGWGVGALAAAGLAGSLGTSAIESVATNSTVGTLIGSLVPGGTGGLSRIFIAAMMGIVGLIAAGCVLQIVMRMRQEESLGTAETVLAAPVARIRWFASFILVAVVAAILILVVSGIVAGAIFAQNGEQELFAQTVVASLVQLPAVLVYLGVLALVFAVAPRATIAVGWVMFGLGTFLGEFGALMKLPAWVRDISPSTHTPAVPLSGVDFSGAWWMTAIAVVAVLGGAAVLRRRDLALG